MDPHLRINLSESLLLSQDFEFLFQEGLKHLQQYAQDNWTDYNHHDPGVTMLEYLCFGITDLGYRADFPISDLLYSTDNQKFKIVDNAFYEAQDILPGAPLTIQDYRRLILDQIDGINNAWVFPVKDLHENYKGLYDVQIQIKTDGNVTYNPEQLIKEIWRYWMENRNLGEDLRFVQILEEEPIEFKFTVYLNKEASAEQVLATIVNKLEHFLNPLVTYHSFDDLLAEGTDINELLDGPKPWAAGKIDMDILHEAPTPVYKAHIQDMLSKIPGVKSISNLRVIREGFLFNEEEISFSANHFLILNRSHKNWSNSDALIEFKRNNSTITPDSNLTAQNYRVLVANNFSNINPDVNFTPKSKLQSEKKLEDIRSYYSIQRFFPIVYGIGHLGLPSETGTIRQILAKQLKGYLAIFETLFSSYLKQLSEIKYLYAITPPYEKEGKPIASLKEFEEELNLTSESNKYDYAFEFPADIPDIESLIDTDKHKEFETGEKSIELFFRRCNTFLDHLLARFGESLETDWLHQFLYSPEDIAETKYQQLISKYLILQDYKDLSAKYGLGFNYRPPKPKQEDTPELKEAQAISEWPGKNVSGLKKKLCYLLNIHDYSDRSLTDFNPFTGFKLSKEKEQDSQESTLAIPLDVLLERGHSMDSYLIKESNFYEVFFYPCKDKALFKGLSYTEAKDWLINFTKKIADFNKRSKGLFVVEHILLRPVHERLFKMELIIPYDEIIKEKGPSQAPDEEKESITFQSLHFSTSNELEKISNELISIASNPDNYEVFSEGDLNFVLIKRGGKPILISQGDFSEKSKVDTLLKNSVRTFKNLLDPLSKINDANSDTQNNFLKVDQWLNTTSETVREIDSRILDKEFYQHKISLILPNWPNVFKDEEFQAIFLRLVKENLPSHLQAQVLWLDWAEMQDFEKAYLNWWKVKSDPAAILYEIDQKAAELIKRITPIEDESVDPSSNKEPELLLSIKQFNLIYEGDKIFQILDETDLQIIDGIDYEIEFYLKKENIPDWNTLGNIQTDILDNLLRNIGFLDKIPKIQTWQVQALTAQARNWSALRELQQFEGTPIKLDQFVAQKIKALFRY